MSYVRLEASGRRHGPVLAAAIVLAAATAGAASEPSADDIMRHADRQRGLGNPCRFLAVIYPQNASATGAPGDDLAPPDATVVEVRANGFEQQLVFVLKPSRGDVMLATPDIVWLRPRRLHRLTRIPSDLRMFNGASVSDVTSIDLLGSYAPTLRTGDDIDAAEYVVDLRADRDGVRYPRASYRIRRDDFRPLRIDLMSASGKQLKSITYANFDTVLGRTIPTKLIVQDFVYKDTSIVLLSDFQMLTNVDPRMFVPDYLLALPDLTS